ncbi:MAG TPA: SRPBCC family protein [Solirubrobacteraceae bacterium]
MKTWTVEKWVAGTPQDVLELLTEPEAIARWAPIPFEVLELDGDRLEAGTRARVRGSLAGRGLEFDVEIREAAPEALSLVASGPVSIGAEYLLSPVDGGSEVRASVSVSGRGLLGGLLARAFETVLAAGALSASVARIGQQLQPALAA